MLLWSHSAESNTNWTLKSQGIKPFGKIGILEIAKVLIYLGTINVYLKPICP